MASTNGASAPPEQSGGSTNTSNLGKDEVAWFFVEQYYTTLSKSPEKLHLFYSKRSQFVYGQEAEVADVSVGRQAIQERIKALDLSDTCKVRISNVDSQSSFDNIVIQVIGETSNKEGDDPKKFVQTFVLAQQPSGYFVLNDILRYLDEQAEEEQSEPAPEEPAVEEPAPATVETPGQPQDKPEPAAEEPAPVPTLDAGVIDEKLEEVAVKEETPVNGEDVAESVAEPAAAAPETAAPAEVAPTPDPEETVRQITEEDTKEPEKPTDPSPTPVAARQQAPAPQPAAPAQPPKPMTWASRAAAAAGPPRPVVPLPKTATPPAQARPAGQPAAAPAKAAPAAAQPTDTPAAAATAKESSEWQTAGSDSKRHNRPQSVSVPQGEKEGIQGYVKYVTEKVQHDDLKAALAQYGELVYFDINRAKSCAFVEFATPAGYQAAVAASPISVNGENISVEPRRPKAQAYGGANYGSGRGNVANRGGRGGFDGNRSASQRGNFGGQNRGRGGVRGRGGAQATNA